ncbi:MAG: SusE domain-containing protein [Kaistella sp.]
MLLTSCRNEDFSITGSPEPSFKLYDTSLGSNVLYPTMENNTFRLVWDETVGSTQDYKIIMSATEDFKTPITFGTTKDHTFSSTVGELNSALLMAEFSPYSPKRVYFRIEVPSTAGVNLVSNVISFDVTPYPIAKPVITNPTAGTALMLNADAPTATATTIKWVDYMYGVNVTYTIEIAKSGSSVFYSLGTVENAQLLEVSNLKLDQAVLKTGAVAGVASNFDLRVTATTESTGGIIVNVSDLATFTVTPYQLESFLYAPGAYQGWDPSTAEALSSATSNGVYVGYINFTTPSSEFKLTTARNWDNSYGATGANTLVYNGGDNLVAPNTGYQKLTADINALTYTLEAYSWGIIGSASPGGWDTDTDMVWNSTAQVWEIANIALTAGDIKFRLNNGWDTNFGDDGNNGSLEPGGANIPITEAGNYKITFDEVNLVWTKTKL